MVRKETLAKGIMIDNCCLGHYRAKIRGSYFCMLTGVINCDKRSELAIDGIFLCKGQTVCERCDYFMDWIASGIPKEEWIELKEITEHVRIIRRCTSEESGFED